jgi:hypothetical protein
MRNVRRLVAASILSFVICMTAVAGDMAGPGYAPPDPPPASPSGEILTPGALTPPDDTNLTITGLISAGEDAVNQLLLLLF